MQKPRVRMVFVLRFFSKSTLFDFGTTFQKVVDIKTYFNRLSGYVFMVLWFFFGVFGQGLKFKQFFFNKTINFTE